MPSVWTLGLVPVDKAARQASEKILDVVRDRRCRLPFAVSEQRHRERVLNAVSDSAHRLPEATSGKGRLKGAGTGLALEICEQKSPHWQLLQSLKASVSQSMHDNLRGQQRRQHERFVQATRCPVQVDGYACPSPAFQFG